MNFYLLLYLHRLRASDIGDHALVVSLSFYMNFYLLLYLHRLRASETGDHAFCIDNSFSHFANKVVFFELFTNGDDDDEEEDNAFDALPDDTDYEIKLDTFKVFNQNSLVLLN